VDSGKTGSDDPGELGEGPGGVAVREDEQKLYDSIQKNLKLKLEQERFYADCDKEELLRETCYPVKALFMTALDFVYMHKTSIDEEELKNLPTDNLKRINLYKLRKRVMSTRSPEYRMMTFKKLKDALFDAMWIAEQSYGILDDIENLLDRVIHIIAKLPPTAAEKSLVEIEEECLMNLAVIFRTYMPNKTGKSNPCGLGSDSPFVAYIHSCYTVAGFPDPETPKGRSWVRERLRATELDFNAQLSTFPKIDGKPDHLTIKYDLEYFIEQHNVIMRYLAEAKDDALRYSPGLTFEEKQVIDHPPETAS
jgi:hypothetical protein